MIVELRKHRSWPTYSLRLGDSFYEINEQAFTGQGVCIYQGEVNDPELLEYFLTGHRYTRWPLGIIRAACTLARSEAIEQARLDEAWKDGV